MSAPLRSTRFRRERQAGWQELEELLHRLERRGPARMEAAELGRAAMLYRRALSSLSVARAISLDRNLLDYLENLGARAFLAIHGTRQSLGEGLLGLVRRRWPQAMAAHLPHLAIALFAMGLGVWAGDRLVAADPMQYHALVPAGLSGGRGPDASPEDLRRILYPEEEPGLFALGNFSSMLWAHNSRVGILAFALGIGLGIPTVALLFQNGLMLGAMAQVHGQAGLGLDFWAWVLPHGVTELLAVAMCGAAGLRIAQAVVLPGPRRRRDELARAGRSSGIVVMGAVAMLLAAGLVEGYFRQLVVAREARLAVAAASGLFWLLLLWRVRARGRTP